jgi:GT2 family glycosyltransferase
VTRRTSEPSKPHGGARRELDASVVICTKDRGASVLAAIEAVLANQHAAVEIIVIDQSSSSTTERAVAPLAALGSVRYVRTTDIGVSRSRNLGLELARSDLVLMTDDDCRVDRNWIRSTIAAFASDDQVAIVLGNVVAPPTAPAATATPQSISDEDFVVGSVRQMRFLDGACCGIGASMALRRSMARAIGGFDDQLGPGAALRAAEDADLTLRTLLAGHHVLHATSVVVEHDGARSLPEFRTLVRSSSLGLGAVCGKLLREHPLVTTAFTCHLLSHLVVRPALHHAVRLQRPPVVGRMVCFARGLWIGLRAPVVRPALVFGPAADRPLLPSAPSIAPKARAG